MSHIVKLRVSTLKKIKNMSHDDDAAADDLRQTAARPE